MKCRSCEQMFSHKKVKWKPRELSLKNHPDKVLRELGEKGEKIIRSALHEKKLPPASPNSVFGYSEYEYLGKCPECKEIINCLWFGRESIMRNKTILKFREPFLCSECENQINRELQVWYSRRWDNGDKKWEDLITMCPKCNKENGYPFEYDLDKGFIE